MVAWSFFAWAAGLVLFFNYQEGLFEAPWMQHLGFRMPVHPQVFREILRHVGGSYRVWWENVPWAGMGWAALALAAYVALGSLFIDCWNIFPPRWEKLPLAIVFGTGISGLLFELLTMAHLLRRPVAIGAWIGMFAAVIITRDVMQQRFRKRWPEFAGGPQDPSKFGETAREWDQWRIEAPALLERLIWKLGVAVFAVVTLLTLIHAVGEPETYWDSLILYMGYAREIFYQESFPYKVVGQVGIGLGANYPHLYALLSAQTAAVAGFWDDSFAQLLPPVCVGGACVLVYFIVREITLNRVAAVSAVLLVRCIPYGIAYSEYASDYAVAILYTAAFLYLAQQYLSERVPAFRNLMLLVAAFAVHINYLMWILWPMAALTIILAHTRRAVVAESISDRKQDFEARSDSTDHVTILERPAFLGQPDPSPFGALIRARGFWVGAAVCLAVALPWYIRNVVLTGNPVYAFFFNIFPSKHVNPEVMRSAAFEWLTNGDGLGRAGHTLGEKLRNSWEYFVTGPQHWKLSPVMFAFAVPGFLLVVITAALRLGPKRQNNADISNLRFGLVCVALFAALWFYAYAVADYYLYQIIIVLPLFGIFGGWLFTVTEKPSVRIAFASLAIFCALSPGFVMGLMGFKLKRSGEYLGRRFSQFELTALKNLFVDKPTFYRMEFDGDMEMLDRVNALTINTTLLTHENRHMLLPRRVRIVHLDDWEAQKAYGKPVPERISLLDSLGVNYYLYVPNEDHHPINSRLGMDELIGLGYFEEVFRSASAGSGISELHDYRRIPMNQNVLYKRTDKQK